MGTSFCLFTARQLSPEVLLSHGSLSWLGSAGQLSFVDGGGAGLLRGCGQITAGVVVIRMTAEPRVQDSFLSVPYLGRLSSWKMDGQASLSLHASIPSTQFTCASSHHGSLSHKAAGLLRNRRSRFLMAKPQKSHSITLPVSCESKFHPRASPGSRGGGDNTKA